MRNIIFSLKKKIMQVLNRYGLRKKFAILYILCVMTPTIVTDALIIQSVYQREANALAYDMDNTATLFKNQITDIVNADIKMAGSVNLNNKINKLLDTKYANSYDYYDSYYEVINDSFLETMAGITSDKICVFADNDTILDSTFFRKLSGVKNKYWYEAFERSGKNTLLLVYFDENAINSRFNQNRRFLYIVNMNHDKNGCRKIIVIENDESVMSRNFKKISSKYDVCISSGDYVMYSSQGDTISSLSEVDENMSQATVFPLEYKGCEFEIRLRSKSSVVKSVLWDYRFVITALLVFTIMIPFLALILIGNSITGRILKLQDAFVKKTDNKEDSNLLPIEIIEGEDEIASLMHKYNEMVGITNNLIETVYKDKLKKQENDIARKNAELLALQSQINPHFLFNALESIRMHSLLKGEEETSVMVGKLAVMQRQNVEWGSDFVTIKKEMESIEAYLYLQGYRFGDRLSFEIDVEEACEDYLVPKLTIVTFVENACVHGIERKASPGWIFVRVYKKDDHLIIEIEDTGGGMPEDETSKMLEDIQNVTIDVIRSRKHVGILNACLRLKMISNDTVEFAIDSEEGIGMNFEIRIPIEQLRNMEGYQEVEKK